MYDNIKAIITRLKKISEDSTKKAQLKGLSEKLAILIDPKEDVSPVTIDELIAECRRLLKDPVFIYKGISLGFLTCRSEDVVQDLLKILTEKNLELYTDKIKQYLAQHSPDHVVHFAKATFKMEKYDFKKAVKHFEKIDFEFSGKEGYPGTAFRIVREYLAARMRTLIELNPEVLYESTAWSQTEVNNRQPVFFVEELIRQASDLPFNQTLNFIYTIDRHKNVLFSPVDKHFYHINQTQGKNRKSYGAGELQIARAIDGQVIVKEINNKCSLFAPLGTNFLEAVQHWLAEFDFDVGVTMLRNAEINSKHRYG